MEGCFHDRAKNSHGDTGSVYINDPSRSGICSVYFAEMGIVNAGLWSAWRSANRRTPVPKSENRTALNPKQADKEGYIIKKQKPPSKLPWGFRYFRN